MRVRVRVQRLLQPGVNKIMSNYYAASGPFNLGEDEAPLLLRLSINNGVVETIKEDELSLVSIDVKNSTISPLKKKILLKKITKAKRRNNRSKQ